MASTPEHEPPHAGPSTTRPPKSAAGGTAEFTRPPYQPQSATPQTPCLLSTPGRQWILSQSHDVHFHLPNFRFATKDLTLHPERNSSLILRADPLPPGPDDEEEEAVALGLERVEEVRVRLMPKQPKRDGKLDQRVRWYFDPKTRRGVVFSTPEVGSVDDLPFYHPPVRKLAYIYEPLDPISHGEQYDGPEDNPQHHEQAEEIPIRGRISVAYLPFEPVTEPVNGHVIAVNNPLLGVRRAKPQRRSPLAASSVTAESAMNGNATEVTEAIKPPATILDPDTLTPANALRGNEAKGLDERIGRVCRALLERVYREAYGNMVGYKKRVLHDVVVDRTSFQDLYLVLKDRYRHLDSRAPKANSSNPKIEDVKRHVWKTSDSSLPSDPSLPSDLSHWGSQDVAIVTFLMLLWKEMYPPGPTDAHNGEDRENSTWGRPPGGFVDLGCGNGLLVHVLISEGYAGKGIELRARRTWPAYPPETRAALIEFPISFPSWFPETIGEWEAGFWPGSDECPIKDGCFIIGNHADEITPWIPLLSLIPPTPVPYLSLPCCLHTLDGSFNPITYTPPDHPHTPEGGFEKGLEEGQSRYKAYLVWLGWSGLKCGWKWEKEGLRIPSTKGWGIVARDRWASKEDDRECRRWALEEVQGVRDRGLFKVREREGKEKDH